jgi:hypothetical protein
VFSAHGHAVRFVSVDFYYCDDVVTEAIFCVTGAADCGKIREAALTHHRRQINRNFFVLENKTHDAKDGTEEASAIPRTCDRSVRLLLLIQCNLR